MAVPKARNAHFLLIITRNMKGMKYQKPTKLFSITEIITMINDDRHFKNEH